ncbi:hypothetical protein Taro_013613 [Colocasia esculenta]|uniref:Uncharacterized protein n=1 Tax=Colocasia esculenta TaxID=4460 RepID=A0A843UCK0_COLES|nr:hypothetical protein [Colocasia esculenta]
MGLRVEQQLNLSSVAARLRGSPVWFVRTCGLISLARLRPVRGRRTRVRIVIKLTGLNSEDRHNYCPRVTTVVSQMMTLPTPTGTDWSDERPGVIEME